MADRPPPPEDDPDALLDDEPVTLGEALRELFILKGWELPHAEKP